MSEDLQTYMGATNSVVGYLTNQLSSFGLWKNIPGMLTKISTSAGGYVWGYNRNDTLYVCKEPCSGGWTIAPPPSVFGNMYDITTDNNFVYILYWTPTEVMVATKNVDGSGEWTTYPGPAQFTKIVTTNQYLWGSGNGKTGFCAKPCTTNNWILQDDNRSLLGGGGSAVFASVPGELGIVRTDETAQTGWKPVEELKDVAASVLGAEADNTVLYAADSARMYRCDDTCEPVSTQGYVPTSISVNPASKNVWFTSSSSSTGGNIFERMDSPNTNKILQYVDQVETQRDNTFNSLGGDYKIQTAQVASKLAQDEAAAAIKQSLDLTGRKDSLDNNIELLRRNIQSAQSFSSGYSKKLEPLYTLLVTLVVTVLIYMVGSWILPSSVMMVLALATLSVGFGLAIYFSIHNNGRPG